MIKLKNVNKKYDKLILNNLNITFENGLIGIIGSSGCGKSTLLNLISLLTFLELIVLLQILMDLILSYNKLHHEITLMFQWALC